MELGACMGTSIYIGMGFSMKVSKNFDLKEYVDPNVFSRFGERSLWFIRPELIDLVQFMRDYFNTTILINTWSLGDTLKTAYLNSGFRSHKCRVGALYSQHRFGNAADLKFPGKSIQAIREEIMREEQVFYDAGLRAIEKGTEHWLHVDCRNTNQNHIFQFYPKKP